MDSMQFSVPSQSEVRAFVKRCSQFIVGNNLRWAKHWEDRGIDSPGGDELLTIEELISGVYFSLPSPTLTCNCLGCMASVLTLSYALSKDHVRNAAATFVERLIDQRCDAMASPSTVGKN